MKTTILVSCKMFDRYQLVQVLSENEILESTPVNIDEVPYTILAFAKRYNCDMVNIKGAKMFTKKIAIDTQNEEMATYSTNNLKFNFIR